MCKSKFNKIYKMKDDGNGEEIIEVDNLDVDAVDEQENLMCQICNERITEFQYVIQCPYCGGGNNSRTYAHLECVKA